MLHWDYYLCLLELEAARRNCSADSGESLLPRAASPAAFPWPFGAALLLIALSTTAAALWHS
jgi:hypothetical protein